MVPEPEPLPHITKQQADDEPAEVELEVSDLRALDHNILQAPVAWYRQQVTVPRWLASACVIALLLLVVVDLVPGFGGQLLAVIAPTPTASPIVFAPAPGLPKPTASPFPTAAPIPTAALVPPALGLIPAECPASTATSLSVVGIPNERTYAVGGPNVWVGGFDNTHAVMSITRDATDQYSPWGWPVAIDLDVRVSIHAPITLVAHDSVTNSPLWWAFAVNDGYVVAAAYTVPTPTFTIDPQQDQGLDWSADGASTWYNGVLYLPGAGCYTLKASWPGGSWTATFAAGR